MKLSPVILWFRHDLRLQDNPALSAAVARGGPIIPVFILDRAGEGSWPPGAAACWWLHHSLASLDGGLRAHKSRLVLMRGDRLDALRTLVRETAAGAVYWNRRPEPVATAHDQRVAANVAVRWPWFRKTRTLPTVTGHGLDGQTHSDGSMNPTPACAAARAGTRPRSTGSSSCATARTTRSADR